MKKHKQKLEFSKKIFYVVISLLILTIISSIAIMWKTNNGDGLAYLIPSVSGLASVSIGFYMNKAKLENQIKLTKKYGAEIVTQAESETSNSEQGI